MLLRVFRGGEPPLLARMAALARVKENFCSISRRGMVGCMGWLVAGMEVMVVGWLEECGRWDGVNHLVL